MTISSKFVVASDFGSTATRESGADARARIVTALRSNDVVTLDFRDTLPTPSFADEMIGRLAEELGESVFRKRIEIVNVDDAVRPLLRQVLIRRLRNGTLQGVA